MDGIEYKFTSEITVTLIDHMGDDARLAMAAWVNKSLEEGLKRAVEKPQDVEGVIRYLMKHRHGTPFEHSALTMYVHAPIFVWREWHRHRIAFSYNEESARYKTLDPVFYIPPRDRPMIKVENWKAGRPKFKTLDEVYGEAHITTFDPDSRIIDKESIYHNMIDDMTEGYQIEYERYLRQLSRNIDPGLARDNLPVGIYSSCWVTTNPRALMHFLSLRTYDETAKFVSYPLYEIEQAARACEKILKEHWPITYSSFIENGRVAP